jgi:hypothetical protein
MVRSFWDMSGLKFERSFGVNGCIPVSEVDENYLVDDKCSDHKDLAAPSLDVIAVAQRRSRTHRKANHRYDPMDSGSCSPRIYEHSCGEQNGGHKSRI